MLAFGIEYVCVFGAFFFELWFDGRGRRTGICMLQQSTKEKAAIMTSDTVGEAIQNVPPRIRQSVTPSVYMTYGVRYYQNPIGCCLLC